MCGGCVKGTVRLFLQLITFIHALLGLGVIVFGVIMLTEQPSRGFSFPHGVLALGGFIAIVGGLGFYSITARKRCCQCFFSMILGLLSLINLALVVMLFIPALRTEMFKFVTDNDGTCAGNFVCSDPTLTTEVACCGEDGKLCPDTNKWDDSTNNATCDPLKEQTVCKANNECNWKGDPNVEKANEWIQKNTMIFQIVLGSVAALELLVVMLTCWYRGKAKERGESWADMDRMLMGGQRPNNGRAEYNYQQQGNVNYQPQQPQRNYNAPPQNNYRGEGQGSSQPKQSRDRMREKYGNHFGGV